MYLLELDYFLQNSTVCDLYGGIREKWPHLSENHFRLLSGVKNISPDSGHLQLDDWEINLNDGSSIIVFFPMYSCRLCGNS